MKQILLILSIGLISACCTKPQAQKQISKMESKMVQFKKHKDGFQVSGVKPASPAYNSGLRDGDIIKEVDGLTVPNTMSFDITKLMDAKSHKIKVLREHEIRDLNVNFVQDTSM